MVSRDATVEWSSTERSEFFAPLMALIAYQTVLSLFPSSNHRFPLTKVRPRLSDVIAATIDRLLPNWPRKIPGQHDQVESCRVSLSSYPAAYVAGELPEHGPLPCSD